MPSRDPLPAIAVRDAGSLVFTEILGGSHPGPGPVRMQFSDWEVTGSVLDLRQHAHPSAHSRDVIDAVNDESDPSVRIFDE